MKTTVMQLIRQFLKSTTLHGFKYLCSTCYIDRGAWAVCCAASACCAGALCYVLWTRFLQVPALLQLHELAAASSRATHQLMPRVAVCPTPHVAAQIFVNGLSMNNKTKWLPTLLHRILERKTGVLPKGQLLRLETILAANNITLPEALKTFMPPCTDLIQKCRWQNVMMSCQKLFKSAITRWGLCCIMQPDLSTYKNTVPNPLEINQRLTLALQCSYGETTSGYGCQFFTKYRGQEWVEPTELLIGHNYMAQLSFVSFKDEEEKLVEGPCVTWLAYSKAKCLVECNERQCGCSDPLRTANPFEIYDVPPPCPLRQFNCILSFHTENNTCGCRSSCKTVTTSLYLESSRLRFNHFTYDPIYAGLNSSSVVLTIRVRIGASKIFNTMSTESWLTLMSSLGGVFNMFLGVGVFSALEFLFMIVAKLPAAVK